MFISKTVQSILDDMCACALYLGFQKNFARINTFRLSSGIADIILKEYPAHGAPLCNLRQEGRMDKHFVLLWAEASLFFRFSLLSICNATVHWLFPFEIPAPQPKCMLKLSQCIWWHLHSTKISDILPFPYFVLPWGFFWLHPQNDE